MHKALATSLILVALVVGIGIGYLISGMDAATTHVEQLGTADETYDLRFIDLMIDHHTSAIDMANDAQSKSQRPEIRLLAGQIIDAQSAEIKQLQEWRKLWYPDSGEEKMK